MFNLKEFISGVISGWQEDATHLRKKDKQLRDDLSEKKIDKMVADSFPASDPPSNY